MHDWKIVKSIFRGNKGFSIGSLVMFTIMITLVFFALIFPGSLKSSIKGYAKDYRLADAWITIVPDTDYPKKELEKTKNISQIDSSYVTDAGIKFKGDDTCSARIFSVAKKDRQRFYTYEGNNQKKFNKLGISQRFARMHSITPGDTISIDTPSGWKDMEVGSIISTPESIVCSRDELSRSDMYEFCYLYLSSDKVDKLFKNGDYINRLSIYCKDGTNKHDIKKAVKKAEDKLGDRVVETTVFLDSQFKSSIDSEMKSLRRTIIFMLFIIFLVGICISTFFVYQVVAKERSMIGILLALGYSKKRIFFVFLQYVSSLAIVAACLGAAVGIYIVKFASSVYLVEFSIPNLVIKYETQKIAVLLILYILAVLLTCVVSFGRISSVDPCEAYGGVVPVENSNSGGFVNLRGSVFSKITLRSMWRSKWRSIAFSMCIAACIILLMMAISTKTSEQRAIPANFGDRYTYDISLRIDGNKETIKSVKKSKRTKEISENIAFRDTVKYLDIEETTQIHSVNNNSDLLVLRDSSGNRLIPGDGIILDAWFADKIGASKGSRIRIDSHELTVTGIADEYIDSTQYVSRKTAKKLGHSKPNTILVKLNENENDAKALKHYKKDSGVYFGSLISGYENLCKDSFKSLGLILNIFACLAVMLGTIIIYNMVVLRAMEKRREYATLLALGIWNKEISAMAFIENLIEYLVAIIVAVPIGNKTSLKLMNVMGTEGHSYLQYKLNLSMETACLISLIFIIIGVFVTIRKVKKIDPAIALNYNE